MDVFLRLRFGSFWPRDQADLWVPEKLGEGLAKKVSYLIWDDVVENSDFGDRQNWAKCPPLLNYDSHKNYVTSLNSWFVNWS